MNSKTKILTGIVIVGIILIGGWWTWINFYSRKILNSAFYGEKLLNICGKARKSFSFEYCKRLCENLSDVNYTPLYSKTQKMKPESWYLFGSQAIEREPCAHRGVIGIPTSKRIIEAGKIININKDHFHQMDPNIYKNKVVWVDLRHNINEKCKKGILLHQPCISEIYLFNIDTGTTKRITNSNTWKENPQLSENYLLWQERKNQITFENERTIAMNLNTGQKLILKSGCDYKLLPNDKVVYIDNGIYIIDLNSNERTKLVEQKSGEYTGISYVDASEEYLIWLEEFWEERGRFGKKIHALNLKTKREIILGEFKGVFGLPRLYKDKVVWENFDIINPEKPALTYQDFDIYLFDLSTEKKSKIISGKGAQTTPNIYDNYITYVDHTDSSYKIYNIANQEIQTIKPHRVFSPYNGVKIHNNTIVWTDHKDCNETSDDIYMLILKYL